MEKLNPEKENLIQCHTQVVNMNTKIRVKIYFILPKIIITKIVAWNLHVGDSAKGIYDMILGRDILTELILTLKSS